MADASQPRLYAALSVQKDATPSQIKKAYHRAALTCHPDKVGAAGEAQFKTVNEAYQILGDAEKRATYDKYGERGLSAMNSGAAAPMMDAMGMSALISFLAVFSLFTVICLTTVVACIAQKVDGKISWSWGSTLFGMWVFDAVAMPVSAVWLAVVLHHVVKDAKESTARQKVQAVLPPIATVMYLAFTAVVGANLDKAASNRFSWGSAFVPFFIAEAITVLLSVTHLSLAAARQRLVPPPTEESPETDPARVPGWAVGVSFFFDVVGLLYRLALAVMIMMQLTGRIDVSWFVVAVPLFLLFGATSALSLAAVATQVAFERMSWAAAACSWIFQSAWLSLNVVAVVLIAIKIDDHGAGRSLSACLIPVYIELTAAFIGACAMLCVAAAFANNASQQDEAYTRMDDDDSSPA
jgi:hypothetical protein